MYWLIVIILAYVFFAFASLGDKLVLAGKPKPNSYTFYVGASGLFVILAIPFIKFGFPSGWGIAWVALDAIAHIVGLYTMFTALEKFDVSKVLPTIGATQPIFIFVLTWIFFGPQAMQFIDIVAFILLFMGSVIISFEKSLEVTGDYLKFTIISSLMFSLDYVFSKFVFLNQPFLQGIIWIRILVFIFVLVFLISKKSRSEIFSKQLVTNKKTQGIFLYTQVCGGAANFLQSFAIYLAPVVFLATINSLKGIQYIFIFIMTLLLSIFLPNVLKEKLSKRIIFQKIISIIFIVAGLAILIAN
jgi:hypothetical protein